jgi:hypothetical protein
VNCAKCSTPVILSGTQFCPKCGAKIESLPITPPRRETFTDVRQIVAGLGTDFNILPSQNRETTVTIDASEEVKKRLTMNVNNGVLEIADSSNSSINISINSVRGGGIFISDGNVIGNVMIGNGNRISIGDNVEIGDGKISVTITTPQGVDVSIDSDAIRGTIGDLCSKIEVDTSGSCRLDIGKINDFSADVSGSMHVSISHFNGGKCNVDVSGSCDLSIPSGEIEKLVMDVSGRATLNVNAATEKAVLDVSGSLSGNLRADIVRKDISGSDRLNIIR